MKKLIDCFAESLDVNPSMIDDHFSYGSAGWDSVGHMGLIAAIEEAFDIMIETDDVIDMSSYPKAKEIISKYGVELNA